MRSVLWMFSRMEVKGLENLNSIHGPVIFVANHTSELDPILLPAALPMFSRFSPMFYVSREKSFYQPTPLKRMLYGGLFFEIWGAHPTDVGINNYHLSLKNHLEILKRGYPVFIFPEGDKSFDGTLHEGKGGAAFLSHQTGAPIVPVAIHGAWNTNFLDFFKFKYRYSLSFGTPIYPNDLLPHKKIIKPHDYKLAINRVTMKALRTLMASSSKKIPA